MSHRYPVEVLHLLVSPGHNYFGRPRDGSGDAPTDDRDEVALVAGRGIVGDRFYGRAAHLDAAVTLLVEALEAVAVGGRARRRPGHGTALIAPVRPWRRQGRAATT